MLPDPYRYDTVNVYMPHEKVRLNWFEFVREESPLYVSDKYNNSELPDLKARFVKE